MTANKLVVSDNVTQLLAEASNRWFECATRAIEQRGSFNVALAGGSTPENLYKKLAADARLNALWPKTSLYFGDERCVAPEHADSNYAMVKRSLLDNISGEPPQCFRMEGERSPQDAASSYVKLLANNLPHVETFPVFDLILLGMGTDGHTASLFPDTEGLKNIHDSVIANHIPQLDTWRITLTFPTLLHARDIMILVTGLAKADVIHDILHNEEANYPIKNLLSHATLVWLLDSEAASKTG